MNEQRLTDLENKINEVIKVLNSFSDSNTMPLELQRAIETRLGGFRTTLTTKPVADILKGVNEAGASSYSVAKAPDNIRAITIEGGVTVYIPTYNP